MISDELGGHFVILVFCIFSIFCYISFYGVIQQELSIYVGKWTMLLEYGR